MIDPWRTGERRLLELLADRAVFGLGFPEEQELRQLLETMPDFDLECMERAAAMVQLASSSVEAMPAALYERIRASAERNVRGGVAGAKARGKPELSTPQAGDASVSRMARPANQSRS
ncbi:MAG: hypothetical protein ACYTG0_04470 [Planctomycetota bacterium]|jgi:hypothetical protein